MVYENHPLSMLPAPLNLIPALLALLGLALESNKVVRKMMSSLWNKRYSCDTDIIDAAPMYIILPATGSNIILR
jgi:hypothetical protein